MRVNSILRNVLLLNLAAFLLAVYAVAQAGQLDPTFGTGGIFVAPTGKSATNAVAIQSDGKIVIAGVGLVDNPPIFADTIIRLNTNGTLDTSFGTGGVVNLNPPGIGNDGGFFGMAIQADGKIVAAAAGVSTVQTSAAMVARVESNGSLDTSFGSGGFTTVLEFSAPGEIFSQGLALGPDGKIVMAVGATNPSLMARFTSSGQLDTSFGTGGLVNLQYAGPTRVAIQSNGKILVTSNASGGFITAQAGAITRYDSNGTVDATFGGGGTAASAASASALVLQSDGKILVGGAITSKVNPPQTANDVGFGIIRYNPNGSLDSTFGTKGVAVTDFGATATDSSAFALAVQSNGDVVAAGAAGIFFEETFTSNFGLARYTSAGALDTTFGSDGIVITNVRSTGDFVASQVNALAIQSDGKIVAAGASVFDIEGENGYVARYLGQ